MASMAGLTVYNFPPQPANWDAVGRFYISFCVLWSVLLFSGIGFLIINRHNPIIRVRGLVLPLTAILFLHAYWVLAQLVYPIGMTMPLVLAYDIQYFFMGIWFPLGIALFHAFNLRFLHVAEMQKRFTQLGHQRQPTRTSTEQKNSVRSSYFTIARLRDKDFSSRMLVYIGVGIIVQVILTVAMWLACAKYHPTFGVAGTELKGDTLPEQLIDLGRGWEWWPSVLWQFVWTWVIAPLLLWRAWGIRDTLGWRVQTIGCCISNLHATPMFLIASYVPAFAPVNAYYAPSQWIHLSVLMFEIFTVFVPCWQVMRQRSLRIKALQWNAQHGASKSRHDSPKDWSSSSSLKSDRLENSHDGDASWESGLDRLTMGSLENTLVENPKELQDFSASRDFSGENIAFLRDVATWKATWPEHEPANEELHALFDKALDIYTELVSAKDAEFPINLCATEGQFLSCVFEKAARIVYGEINSNPVLPFIAGHSPSVADVEMQRFEGRVGYWGEIPAEFNGEVFDRAFEEIKYLVFTNTWPKYVLERQSSRLTLQSENRHSC